MSGLELGDNLRDAALLVGFVLVTLIIFLVARLYDGASRPRRGRPWPPHWPSKSRQAYMFEQDRRREIAAADQLRAVMAAPFQRKKLLSVSEYRVFRIIERELNTARRGHRIFA